MATLRDLIDKVATRLRMEGGTTTQTYSEDAIMMGIQHKFDVLFDDYWMPQFMVYQEEYTLDGTTGVVTADLSTKVKRFEDIQAVHNQYSRAPLPRAPDGIRLGEIMSPCVQPHNDTAKVFRIIPVNSSGVVWLTYRLRPDTDWTDDTVINMDEQLLILGTCYDMLEDDGLNPGASDKFLNMFNARVKQYTRNQHNMSMSGAPSQTFPLNRWV